MIAHELDKISEKFNDFIQKNYAARRKVDNILAGILIGIYIILLVIFLITEKGIFSFFLLFVGLFITIIMINIRQSLLKKIHGQYKQTILPNILNLIDNSLIYSVNQGHSKDEFKSTEMYNSKIDNYSSSDLIKGVIDKTSIKISHVFAERIEEETEYDNNNNRTTRQVHYTIFSGVFVTLDFNKYFKGKTRLHTKGRSTNSEPSMGTLFSNYNNVTLENPDFNNLYKVITTDEQQAFYILSPSFMERLIKLYKTSKSGIGIAFINNKMYIGFESSSFLEINPEDDIKKSIRQLYLEIKSIVDIVEELNLNNRIWTKQ